MIKDAIVYVVEDDPAVRKLVASLAKSVAQPLVSFASAQEFMESYLSDRPGCLIVDIRMPEIGGMELIETLAEKGIRMPIIVLTGYGNVQLAVRAFKSGVFDFIEKPFSGQDLLDCIHRAIRLDQDVRRIEEERRAPQALLTKLTQRERTVMDLMLDGGTNKQIADQLSISRKTLDIHRARIFQKMEATSIAELSKKALIALGLMPPSFSFLSAQKKPIDQTATEISE
jgi:two-component system, LuxR family, response regulator FixJ